MGSRYMKYEIPENGWNQVEVFETPEKRWVFP